MDSATLDMTAELADELVANQSDPRPYVRPQDIPTRYSLLKEMARSPAHYRHACQQSQDDSLATRLGAFATDRKEALRFGTAVHQFLLGADSKVVRYSGRRDARTKAYRGFLEDCSARGVVEVLSDKEWHQANAVAAAIRRHETAMRLLFDGTVVEQRIDWTYVGKACRSTPDARGKSHVVDLKTAVTAQPDQFTRHALRLFYHAQAALYAEAIEESGHARPSDAYVIAVEKSPPYPVTIMRFTERTLLVGEKLCRTWIEQLNTSEAADQWPEYLEEIGKLDVNIDGLELEFDGQRFVL